ncbi:polysaccharide deacetylase family protein [Rosettibacter firmus]|uniref:polysaccharide deacetylase family protein n=1 Tax=Rosettibacter firmus TaxID=3111522 RepID=UPI00336C0C91
MINKKIIFIILLVISYNINAQVNLWNNKSCAVVLTYDDALNTHLDNVIPLLDSLGFKATFYLSGFFPGFSNRLNDWRKAAANGHELGNHTLFHPCIGNMEGREWVKPDYDLSKYSIQRITDEILMNNIVLEAVDGKKRRTFAYTCGDTLAGDSSYVKIIKENFPAARGVNYFHQKINEIDLFNIGCYVVNGQSADELIDLVKYAMNNNTLLVFLFHGVGGEHPINISLETHKKLLEFLKANENNIWITTFLDVADFIRKYRTKSETFK